MYEPLVLGILKAGTKSKSVDKCNRPPWGPTEKQNGYITPTVLRNPQQRQHQIGYTNPPVVRAQMWGERQHNCFRRGSQQKLNDIQVAT